MLKKIEVEGYTVSQAGMIHALRRAGMFNKLQETALQYDEETLRGVAMYPLLAGCIDPLISLDDFLQIPEQTLDKLILAAMELNPHWFEVPDQEKKTENEPPTSTSDSVT